MSGYDCVPIKTYKRGLWAINLLVLGVRKIQRNLERVGTCFRSQREMKMVCPGKITETICVTVSVGSFLRIRKQLGGGCQIWLMYRDLDIYETPIGHI